jgi:hypothetical protein
MRMSRTAGVPWVSWVRAQVVHPAQVVPAAEVIHTSKVIRARGSRGTSEAWAEREVDAGRMPHAGRGDATPSQAGRLITHEVVTMAAVSNVAAVSHEVGMGYCPTRAGVSATSIAPGSMTACKAAPDEVAASETGSSVATPASVKATSTTVKAATAPAGAASGAMRATSAARRGATTTRGDRGAYRRRSGKSSNAERGSERGEASTHGCLPEDDFARATDFDHRLHRRTGC